MSTLEDEIAVTECVICDSFARPVGASIAYEHVPKYVLPYFLLCEVCITCSDLVPLSIKEAQSWQVRIILANYTTTANLNSYSKWIHRSVLYARNDRIGICPYGRNINKCSFTVPFSRIAYERVPFIIRKVRTWVVQFPILIMLNATASSKLPRFELQLPWIPWDIALAAATSSLLLLGTLYIHLVVSGKDTNKIHQLGGVSIVNAWTFFNKRYDFLRSNFDKTGHEPFAFKVLHVSVYTCICS